MGRGARVTLEEVADYKDRAARLEAVRAKDKKKYPGATWDYLADTSPRPAQTIMRRFLRLDYMLHPLEKTITNPNLVYPEDRISSTAVSRYLK